MGWNWKASRINKTGQSHEKKKRWAKKGK